MKITAYKLVHGSHGYSPDPEMEKEVNGLIKDGWQPYGPPVFTPGGFNIKDGLVQAMIKIESILHPMSAPSPK